MRAFRDRLVADGVEIVDWWDEPDYVESLAPRPGAPHWIVQ